MTHKPLILKAMTLAMTFSVATPAAAWWDLGHAAVCDFSLQLVSPTVREHIEALLTVEDQERMLTSETFGSGCKWPDRIKDERTATLPWHYFNIDPGVSRVADQPHPEAGDILVALREQLAILADENAKPVDRTEALRFVGHFVGDIHQPMHLARIDDDGGNLHLIALPGALATLLGEPDRRETNMHAVWDGYLLRYAVSARGASLLELMDPIEPPDTLTPLEWAEESLRLNRAPAVGYAADAPLQQLTEDYLQRHSDTAILRVGEAAHRLAALLNDALANASPQVNQ